MWGGCRCECYYVVRNTTGPVFHEGFFGRKKLLFPPTFNRTSRTPKMGDGGVLYTPYHGTDFSRPVQELEYTCLLKNTFTKVSHDRDFKTCQTPETYPECVFCGRVSMCAESQSTSCVTNRTPLFCHLVVGGHANNVVDLCGEDNTDAKGQCFGKGRTMMTKPPSRPEFEECWSELIIKNGLSPSLVDDPPFGRPSSQPLVWGNQPCICA